MPLLSVIIPVYNEASTIKEILERINAIDIDKEVIVVDDGSFDGTSRILGDIKYDNMKLIHHTSNRGKGAAFLTGLSNATGEFVIIQDADLEYDPQDYFKLISAIKGNNADLVLGARFLKGYRGLFWHRIGNRTITWLLNILFGSRLNDSHACYKLAPRSVFNSLGLKGAGFEIDAEIVCNVLKKKMRILQVPVSYNPRSYKAGKKIRWLDGLWAIFYMFKYRFTD